MVWAEKLAELLGDRNLSEVRSGRAAAGKKILKNFCCQSAGGCSTILPFFIRPSEKSRWPTQARGTSHGRLFTDEKTPGQSAHIGSHKGLPPSTARTGQVILFHTH